MEVRRAEVRLDIGTRGRVLDLVRASPGLPMHELARRAEVSWSTLQHHVDRLAVAELVETHIVGRRRLVFPHRPADAISPEQRGLLYEPTARRIAAWYVENPGRSLAELSAETGISARAVYHHALRLLDAGLIVTQGGRGYRGISPTAALLALLAE